MRIIVDAMGGDNAPGEIVRGALAAHGKNGIEIVLVGREKDVRSAGAAYGGIPAGNAGGSGGKPFQRAQHDGGEA